MELSQPTIEPHSLCYTCWVQVVYSRFISLYFLFSFGYTLLLLSSRWCGGLHLRLRQLLGILSPSWCPCDALLRICFTLPLCIRLNVIIVIINSYSFIISFYVTCVVISWWFCCIYVWLDPGAYMIARFMSFVNRVLQLPRSARVCWWVFGARWTLVCMPPWPPSTLSSTVRNGGPPATG
jgi:hypothetical protein